MISKILAVVALFGAAVAIPIAQQVSTFGQLASGAGFTNQGTTVAGAASDNKSGVATAGLKGIGSVLGVASPFFSSGIALASPSF